MHIGDVQKNSVSPRVVCWHTSTQKALGDPPNVTEHRPRGRTIVQSQRSTAADYATSPTTELLRLLASPRTVYFVEEFRSDCTFSSEQSQQVVEDMPVPGTAELLRTARSTLSPQSSRAVSYASERPAFMYITAGEPPCQNAHVPNTGIHCQEESLEPSQASLNSEVCCWICECETRDRMHVGHQQNYVGSSGRVGTRYGLRLSGAWWAAVLTSALAEVSACIVSERLITISCWHEWEGDIRRTLH